MALAQNLCQLGFACDVDKTSKGRKLVSVDLYQCIRAMGIEALLDCWKKQRNVMKEKTKSIGKPIGFLQCLRHEKMCGEPF